MHGTINFGSRVGLSRFWLDVGDTPEFGFEVEVFPSKLDYKTDYEQMVAEVQELLTGLALEYLRSTYQSGTAAEVPTTSSLEWLTILQGVISDLERGMHRVVQFPIRGLRRSHRQVRLERVKKVDSTVRSLIRRGGGTGSLHEVHPGVRVREQIREARANPTLDTPEHRWLAVQLKSIRQRVAALMGEERRRASTLTGEAGRQRAQASLDEMVRVEERIGRLLRLEPMTEARGAPPPGFASVKLLAAPGYREACRACLVLLLGLRVEGGPLDLTVKDLSLLYEYWCYLAVISLVSEETGAPIPPEELLETRESGLQVKLKKGRESRVEFSSENGRAISVVYAPSFAGPDVLIAQEPDILVRIVDEAWPPVELVLDAKYRVDLSEAYRASTTSHKFLPPRLRVS